MTNKTDPRPWAFDNNPPWAAFRAKIEAADLVLRPHSSWRIEDGRTRGDNVTKYLVYGLASDDGTRPLVGMVLAEGFGPDGFALWHLSENSKSDGDVIELRRRADARDAELAARRAQGID